MMMCIYIICMCLCSPMHGICLYMECIDYTCTNLYYLYSVNSNVWLKVTPMWSERCKARIIEGSNHTIDHHKWPMQPVSSGSSDFFLNKYSLVAQYKCHQYVLFIRQCVSSHVSFCSDRTLYLV